MQDSSPRRRASSPFKSTTGAADYLGLSAKTLEKYRVFGGGPRFRKHGRRVVYHRDDLDAWSEERAYRSTLEAEQGAGK